MAIPPPRRWAARSPCLSTAAAVFQPAIKRRTRDEPYTGKTLTSTMGLIRLPASFTVFATAAAVMPVDLGVNLTGLAATLGAGGIAIGPAAQGSFADPFAAPAA